MIEAMNNNNNTATIEYEYPLLERVRTYLRLEHIVHALQPNTPVSQQNFTRYFSALFSVLDLCERSDVRTDVQKDLERRKAQLKIWAEHPDVNQQQLQETMQRVGDALQAIQPMSRVGSNLKQDRLLSAIRQRFAMPGGTCNFDVPQLHFWLHQPQEVRDADTNRWWSELDVLVNGLLLELELMRGQARFQTASAPNGLLQESTEPLSLLRIRVAADLPAYPVISGHKQRFSIRFLRYEPVNGKASYDQNIEFELALCP
jgi:cell division protein ZapD